MLLRDAEIEHLKGILAGDDVATRLLALEARHTQLTDDFAFVAMCNIGGEFMAREDQERLRAIAQQTWLRHFDDRLGLSHDEEDRDATLPVTPRPRWNACWPTSPSTSCRVPNSSTMTRATVSAWTCPSFTYRGVCYMMGSRIFMCDFEHKQQNEMTSTILMPQFRTPIRYMFGLLIGIAATAYGQPFATRVAFERKNDDSVIRKAMVRQATMLQPNDPQIPANVINYIGIGEGTVLLAST